MVWCEGGVLYDFYCGGLFVCLFGWSEMVRVLGFEGVVRIVFLDCIFFF